MLKNIKGKQSGFTIVELLIVIVVIAILAAITIVAYNGIQQRSHTTSSKTAAENLAKKVEAYNAVNSVYPTTNTAALMTTALNSLADSSLAGSGIVIGTPSASTSDSTVQLRTCAGAAQTAGTTVPTGYVVYIWDSTLTTPGLNPVQAGGTGSITAGSGGAANTATCANSYTAA